MLISDKSHTQELAPSSSSLSLPLQQMQHESPSKETSVIVSSPNNITHQNSMLSLTLDEIQIKSGRVFGSMSMDEFLANIWNSDGNHADSQPEFPVQNKNAGAEAEAVNSQQELLSVPPPICKKTVEEVWSEIRKDKRPQQNEGIRGSESLIRQQTLGEMTLEDFLIKAGVVQQSSMPFQIQSGNMIRDNNRASDGGYKMGQAMRMGICSQQNAIRRNVGGITTYRVEGEKCGREGESSRKKRIVDGPPEVVVERRQRRMLKNRESAARSRARRQAYTVELEAGLSQLRQENEKLKEILAEAEKKRKQEVARKKHATNNKAQKITDKFKAMRRTLSAAW